MGSLPERRKAGSDAVLRRGWEAPHDYCSEEDEPAASEAERLARRAADVELVRRVQLEGFDGKIWFRLSRELVAYATEVLRVWVRTGQVFRRCREKGFHVRPPPRGGMAVLDTEDLADETVAFAITRFQREVIAAGEWDPTRGASLSTFFIGMCLKQFPTTYAEWCRRSARDAREEQAANNVFHITDERGRTWRTAPLDEHVAATFAEHVPDEVTRNILWLRDQGYSQAEISHLLGITEGSIESRLYRLRRSRTERRPHLDEAGEA